MPKVFSANVRCSQETYNTVANLIANDVVMKYDSADVRALYVDGHMLVDANTYDYECKNEAIDAVKNILDMHHISFEVETEPTCIEAWTGTKSKNGYIKFYRVTEHYFMSETEDEIALTEHINDRYTKIHEVGVTISPNFMFNGDFSVFGHNGFNTAIVEADDEWTRLLCRNILRNHNSLIHPTPHYVYGLSKAEVIAMYAKHGYNVITYKPDDDMGIYVRSVDEDEEVPSVKEMISGTFNIPEDRIHILEVMSPDNNFVKDIHKKSCYLMYYVKL